MAIRIRKPRQLGPELRRLGEELLGDALARLEDPTAEAIHETRKRCKEVRGLCRMFRHADRPLQKRFDRTVRDASRELSAARDAEARLESFDALAAVEPELLSAVKLAALREPLAAAAREAEREAVDGSAAIDRARGLLETAQGLLPSWPDEPGLHAMLQSVGRTYRRGRKAWKRCAAGGSTDDFHEWRKRVKYGWYHLRYLQHASRSVLRPRKNRLHDLADALGDEHDLAILVAHLRGGSPIEDEHLQRFVRVAEGRQLDLRGRAVGIGARLFAEPTSDHVERLRRYVKAWRRHGRELPIGELEEISG